MRVFHILVEHKYEAEDLLRKLNQGEDFHKLAQKFSKCSSAKTGGDLGEFKSKKFVDEFEDAIEVLKPNKVSIPIRTRFGYHLILVTV